MRQHRIKKSTAALAAGLGVVALLATGCGESSTARVGCSEAGTEGSVEDPLTGSEPIDIDGPLGRTARLREREELDSDNDGTENEALDLRMSVLGIEDDVKPDGSRLDICRATVPGTRFVRIEVKLENAGRVTTQRDQHDGYLWTVDRVGNRRSTLWKRLYAGALPASARPGSSATGYIAAQVPRGVDITAIELRGGNLEKRYTWGVDPERRR